MLSKFLDPKNDVAFKRIFGSEKNKDILIHFLNDMLVFKNKRPIVAVTFLKSIQDPETAALKTSIVDILCEDDHKTRYIVEMQVAREKGFEKRAQYYAAKAYTSQAKQGGAYGDLKEIIFLAIADYVMFPDKKSYKSDHVILDKESFEHDLKDFSFSFIELPKFTKKISQLKTIVDRWCYFFKHAEETSKADLAKVIGEEKIIERVYDELERFGWSEEELRGYDQAEKYRWAFEGQMAQSFDDGLAKGQEIGLAKGEEIGLARGREELQQAKQEMARALLQQKVPLEVISEATGLSKAELKLLITSK